MCLCLRFLTLSPRKKESLSSHGQDVNGSNQAGQSLYPPPHPGSLPRHLPNNIALEQSTPPLGPDSHIGDVAVLNGSFRTFFDESYSQEPKFVLPKYNLKLVPFQQLTYSPQNLLMILDIVKIMHENFLRARLILYETARNARPFASLMPGSEKRIKLEGGASTLDRTLAELHCIDVNGIIGLNISNFFSLRTYHGGLSHEEMRTEILSDPEIIKILAAGKASLLRLDHQFRKRSLTPLKDSMINGNVPNYTVLEAVARMVHNDGVSCFTKLNNAFLQQECAIMARILGESFDSERFPYDGAKFLHPLIDELRIKGMKTPNQPYSRPAKKEESLTIRGGLIYN